MNIITIKTTIMTMNSSKRNNHSNHDNNTYSDHISKNSFPVFSGS
jgi:hypothetical protein